jgi:hypothetical protein
MKSRYGEREESVEDYLERRVRELCGETRKMVWGGRRRAADRLVGFPADKIGTPDHLRSQHFLVELKMPGLATGFPRLNDGHEMAQWREHQRLRSWGFRVYVIDSKEGVDAIL